MKPSVISCLLVLLCLSGHAGKSYGQEKYTVFNHIALSVYDLEKSASFYQNVLLLDTIPEPFKIGRHKWFAIGGGLSLHLVRDAKEIKEHNRSTHMCFSVKSIDDFIARLDRFGVAYYNVHHERGKVNVRVRTSQRPARCHEARPTLKKLTIGT